MARAKIFLCPDCAKVLKHIKETHGEHEMAAAIKHALCNICSDKITKALNLPSINMQYVWKPAD